MRFTRIIKRNMEKRGEIRKVFFQGMGKKLNEFLCKFYLHEFHTTIVHVPFYPNKLIIRAVAWIKEK